LWMHEDSICHIQAFLKRRQYFEAFGSRVIPQALCHHSGVERRRGSEHLEDSHPKAIRVGIERSEVVAAGVNALEENDEARVAWLRVKLL